MIQGAFLSDAETVTTYIRILQKGKSNQSGHNEIDENLARYIINPKNAFKKIRTQTRLDL